MRQPIKPGFSVVQADGHATAGAVPEVKEASHLVVTVENGGDFAITADAVRDVRDVRDSRVFLDLTQLPLPMQNALRHLRDAGFPASQAADPAQ